MPTARIDANLDKPDLDVLVDLGHPFPNRVFDAVVKCGGVAALHAASQESLKFLFHEEKAHSLEKPHMDKPTFDKMVQNVGVSTLHYGLAAGVYSGVTYGLEEAGVHDWKKSLVAGAVTGAAAEAMRKFELSGEHHLNAVGQHALTGALTGAAIATACEFLKNIT
ncbi:unnamed protein product [Calypogeia fissa]